MNTTLKKILEWLFCTIAMIGIIIYAAYIELKTDYNMIVFIALGFSIICMVVKDIFKFYKTKKEKDL